MTDDIQQGLLTEVTVRTAGSETSQAHLSGATTLSLYDTSDFDDEGGALVVQVDVDESYNLGYNSKDDDLNQLTLSSGLPVDIDQDTQVLLYPLAVDKYAQVTVDDTEDSILARVPYDLAPSVDEGVRDPGDYEAVLVELQGIEYVVKDFPGKEGFLDGTLLDPADVPNPLTPTEPPAASPEILKITGTTTSLVVQTEEPEFAADIEYHISLTEGFTPTAGDTTTMIADTASQVVSINKLPDGTPLTPDVTYYLRTFAHNDLGYALGGPSSQADGQLDMSNVNELIIATLITGFVLAGLIQVGNIFISADEGIVIRGPDDETVLQFPPDGSDLSMTAKLVATALTVVNGMDLSGASTLYGTLDLYNSIQNPTAAPTMATFWPKLNSDLYENGNDVRDHFADAIEYPSDTSKYLVTRYFEPSGGGGSFGMDLTTYDKATGNKVADLLGNSFSHSWNLQYTPGGGLCYVPATGCYYILGQDGFSGGDWYFRRINATTFNGSGSNRLGNSNFFGGFSPRLFFDSVGNRIGIVYVLPPSGFGTAYQLRVRYYDTTSSLTFLSSVTLIADLGNKGNIGGAEFVDPGTGTAELYVSFLTFSGSPLFNQGAVHAFNLTTNTENTAHAFNQAYDVRHNALFYDSVAGQFRSIDKFGVQALYGTDETSRTVQAKYSWYDADSTGSTHTTAPSPQLSFSLPARAYLSLATPPPPDATNPDSGNHDRANQVNVFATINGGTTWRLKNLSASPWSFQQKNMNDLGTTTPPASNTFPAALTPGIVRSGAADAGVDGFTNKITLKGDGSFRLGNYTSVRHYGKYQKSADQTGIATNTGTTLTFNTAITAATGLSFGSNQFTIAKSGLYLLEASCLWDDSSNATGRRGIAIVVNGSTVAQSDTAPGVGTLSSNVHTLAALTPGDVVSVLVIHNAGVNKTVQADVQRTWFSCGFVSA